MMNVKKNMISYVSRIQNNVINELCQSSNNWVRNSNDIWDEFFENIIYTIEVTDDIKKLNEIYQVFLTLSFKNIKEDYDLIRPYLKEKIRAIVYKR